MSKLDRALNAKSDATPIGGRYYKRNRTAVSGPFIKSLSDDGISRDTIRAIMQDNAKRPPAGDDRAPDRMQ